jgi:hypothetical protein
MQRLVSNPNDISGLEQCNNYTIGPEYINIYHFLATMNNGLLIKEARKKAKSRYLALEDSPLSMAEAETGKVLMDALFSVKSNRCIIERFNLKEMYKIIELPVNVDFF